MADDKFPVRQSLEEEIVQNLKLEKQLQAEDQENPKDVLKRLLSTRSTI